MPDLNEASLAEALGEIAKVQENFALAPTYMYVPWRNAKAYMKRILPKRTFYRWRGKMRAALRA